MSKLEPWRLRSTLAFAGRYQLTHELIKESVLDRVRGFYLTGFDQLGYTYDEESYAADVMTRAPRQKMRASLLWLVSNDAITLEQADRLDAIYAHRHELTHELGKCLMDPAFEPSMELFTDAVTILRSILRFWTRVEIDVGTFEEHGEVERRAGRGRSRRCPIACRSRRRDWPDRRIQ